MGIKTISLDPRITVRKPAAPNPEGECVVYWMQRAQRALDNPALDVAVKLGNELGKPVVAFLAPVPFYPHANLRHYRFLASGIPDIEEGLSKRNVGFVLRTYPDYRLIKFCEQVHPAIVISDENPLREAEHWRVRAAQDLKVPLWTVDADVVVTEGTVRIRHKPAYGSSPTRCAGLETIVSASRESRPAQDNSLLAASVSGICCNLCQLGAKSRGFLRLI